MRKWTDADIARLDARHAAGESWQAIADSLGVNREKIRSVVRSARKQGRLPDALAPAPLADVTPEVPEVLAAPAADEPAPAPAPTVNEAVQAERDRAKRRADIVTLKQLTSRRAWMEDIYEAVRTAALAVDVPSLRADAAQLGTFDEETAVLLISDVHVGQHTPALINGGWEQTLAVTQDQMRRLGDAVLRIWDIQHRSTPWRQLVIRDLGDDVEHSNMRASQHRYAEPLVAQQSAAYGVMFADLIQRCLTVFAHVRVERVPGNHGRVSEKAGNAGMDVLGPENSFDWIGGAFAAEILRAAIDAGRLTFINHANWYARTEVVGRRIVFEHGSSLRGGGSWGGIPYYAIDRMAASYRDLEGAFDILALGHYHRPYVLPAGYGGVVIGNGSFPPTTPFVVAAKHAHTRPTQTLLSLHPKKGITMIRHLYLDTVRADRVPPGDPAAEVAAADTPRCCDD